MSLKGLGWFVGAVALSVSAPLAAQSPTLARVEDLAQMGRAEEARVELMDWWNGARDDSSQRDLQLGLWLRGRLTVDPAQAALDFQRLVVLYPSSPYTPQALLRLAQASHAQGDAEAARRHVATLVRDYPSSDSRREAEAWLASAGTVGPAPSNAPAAPSTSAQAPRPTQPPPAAGTDSTTSLQFREPRPPSEPLIWFVQFGAFADEGRAFALHEELVNAGMAARLVSVEGSAFLHVRIGRFATREEANRQLQQVEARGFTASIVRDERPESVERR
jgi:cell division septation protein DedD